MSRRREPETVRFQIDGDYWITRTEQRKTPPGWDSIPAKSRLVNIIDEQRHLVAVVVTMDNANGLLMTSGPRSVITDDMFRGFVAYPSGELHLLPGTESDSIAVFCQTCLKLVDIPVAPIVEAIARFHAASKRRARTVVVTT